MNQVEEDLKHFNNVPQKETYHKYNDDQYISLNDALKLMIEDETLKLLVPKLSNKFLLSFFYKNNIPRYIAEPFFTNFHQRALDFGDTSDKNFRIWAGISERDCSHFEGLRGRRGKRKRKPIVLETDVGPEYTIEILKPLTKKEKELFDIKNVKEGVEKLIIAGYKKRDIEKMLKIKIND